MGTLRYIKPGDVVLLVLEPKTFVGDAIEAEVIGTTDEVISVRFLADQYRFASFSADTGKNSDVNLRSFIIEGPGSYNEKNKIATKIKEIKKSQLEMFTNMSIKGYSKEQQQVVNMLSVELELEIAKLIKLY